MNKILLGLGALGSALISCSKGDLAGVIITENTIQGTARMADSSASKQKVYLYQAGHLQSPVDSATPNARGIYQFKGKASGKYFVVSDSADLLGNQNPEFNYDSTRGALQDIQLKPLVQVVLELKSKPNQVFSPLGAHIEGNKVHMTLSPDSTTQSLVVLDSAKNSQNLSFNIQSVGVQVSNSTALNSLSFAPRQTLVDNRDGSLYHTVQIGSQTWIAENIHYQTPLGDLSSVITCPFTDTKQCQTWGLLYTWNGLLSGDPTSSPDRTVCPVGYSFAEAKDFQNLIQNLGGAERAALILKSKTGWSTPGLDLYGLDLKPSESYPNSVEFWTNTSIVSGQSDTGYALLLDHQKAQLIRKATNTFAAARCIKRN